MSSLQQRLRQGCSNLQRYPQYHEQKQDRLHNLGHLDHLWCISSGGVSIIFVGEGLGVEAKVTLVGMFLVNIPGVKIWPPQI